MIQLDFIACCHIHITFVIIGAIPIFYDILWASNRDLCANVTNCKLQITDYELRNTNYEIRIMDYGLQITKYGLRIMNYNDYHSSRKHLKDKYESPPHYAMIYRNGVYAKVGFQSQNIVFWGTEIRLLRILTLINAIFSIYLL
jgi:hypothetical protein